MVWQGYVRVSGRADGMERLQRMFEVMRKRVSDLSPWFQDELLDGDDGLHAIFEANWNTKGAFLGDTWAPLSAKTLLNRRSAAKNHPGAHNRNPTGSAAHPLWDTGDLRSIFVDPGDSRLDVTIEPWKFRIETHDGKAAAHQHGYVSPTGGDVPARHIVPDTWPEKVTRRWEKSLARFVLESTGEVPFTRFKNLAL